ncbi:hypothetical protein JZ751_021446 [Albula glossodonta]|uniref:Uncharacterized protein n=1 Tax=Albula glossodonta TaxID=121402 RepID=A0A8T2MUR0_9TELE|nr:hypothetical protein JZ751_021446 [Albula glossodonta]
MTTTVPKQQNKIKPGACGFVSVYHAGDGLSLGPPKYVMHPLPTSAGAGAPVLFHLVEINSRGHWGSVGHGGALISPLPESPPPHVYTLSRMLPVSPALLLDTPLCYTLPCVSHTPVYRLELVPTSMAAFIFIWLRGVSGLLFHP